MRKLQKNEIGFSVVEAITLVVIVVLIGMVGWLAYKYEHQTTTATTTTTSSTKSKSITNTASSYAVLPPATVPSKLAECSQQLTISQDGNAIPVTCSNGDLNILEWNYLKGVSSSRMPLIMTLGYNATNSQVQTATCSDLASGDTSYPIEGSTYQISALYYGWNFSDPLAAEVQNGNC